MVRHLLPALLFITLLHPPASHAAPPARDCPEAAAGQRPPPPPPPPPSPPEAPPAPDAAQRQHRLQQALGLSADKAAQVDQLLHEGHQREMQGRRQSHEQVREQTRKGLAALLSAEQLTKLEQLPRPPRPPEPGHARQEPAAPMQAGCARGPAPKP